MWLWIATACLPKLPPPPPTFPGAPEPVGDPWSAVMYADDPLVGRIWDVHRRAWASEEQLVADLKTVDVVLVGEKHDNPDHHRLQARIVTALRPASCVFEMLDDGDPIAAARAATELAALAQWDTSGWPPFAMYAPVFDACYGAGAQVVAGHPTRRQVKTVMSGEALPAAEAAGVPIGAIDDGGRKRLVDAIAGSHCGQLPPEMTGPMVAAQELKDGWMARAVLRSPLPTVLVAGTGHADAGFGVPRYLGRPSRSVMFVEVDSKEYDPARYGFSADWLWFTPAVDDLDPCAAFHVAPK